jgi:hypothetical protein
VIPRMRHVGALSLEEIGNCKNIHRKAPVALHPVLGDYLRHWQSETMYTKPMDWVFASTKLKGAKPRCGTSPAKRTSIRRR